MPQVAVYCRLSIEDRNKLKSDDSQSIQNQKLMLVEYCKERCWDIYDIYCDDGFSGIDKTRPEFNRMINDCRDGKINIVLCKDQSRFSRDTVIIEQYINDKFIEWNIRFIGVVDNADSDSEAYSTMRLFTSAYNEMYVKDISGKIRKTLKYKREQGQFVGSFAPYGYAVDPDNKNHLIIDEEAAAVVKKIFSMYAQGNGYRKIVQWLNEHDFPSPALYKKNNNSNFVSTNEINSSNSGLWTQSTIYTILRNEMYIGTLVQGKSHNINYKNKKKKKVPQEEWVRIPNTHEAIIDKDTWESCQNRIKSRTRTGSGEQTLSPLSGKVKCAVCGRPMKRNVYYNKERTIKYYGLQCATYKTGAMNCSNTKSISGIKLESIILDELDNLMEQYCQSENIMLTDTYQEQLCELNSILNKLKNQLSIVENRLTTLYTDKLDGIISAKEYSMFSEKFRNELSDINDKINDTESQIEYCKSKQTSSSDRLALINKYSHFTKVSRNIAEEFIDSILIGEFDSDGKREITINWKI